MLKVSAENDFFVLKKLTVLWPAALFLLKVTSPPTFLLRGYGPAWGLARVGKLSGLLGTGTEARE